MIGNLKLLFTFGFTFFSASLFAQDLQPVKQEFDFVRNGSMLLVKNRAGQDVTAIDLDKPALKGKVIAFTYSAKKRQTADATGHSFSVFPNPASKQVNLQFKGQWKYPVAVQIFDKSGNALHSTKLESVEQPLDIGSLEQGIYILKAYSGNASAVEKLVVQ
ncbi:hypothetical protein GCM10010967_14870 [Dyadobacter beijingensis]|uniref:Secretion system C-terminal sorting domain-containing protein n=1 Tax=Dyadobacter beijingensis TaxID=365489 RepID=A0ABQ2HNV8_9BACT|nr:T9SS type A sorting domain-containing protein [Dyadobacter beijingensis]GGM84106.1 hypothetical protein GCM10010967_14870 [Dyadobacter beijingensis]